MLKVLSLSPGLQHRPRREESEPGSLRWRAASLSCLLGRAVREGEQPAAESLPGSQPHLCALWCRTPATPPPPPEGSNMQRQPAGAVPSATGSSNGEGFWLLSRRVGGSRAWDNAFSESGRQLADWLPEPLAQLQNRRPRGWAHSPASLPVTSPCGCGSPLGTASKSPGRCLNHAHASAPPTETSLPGWSLGGILVDISWVILMSLWVRISATARGGWSVLRAPLDTARWDSVTHPRPPVPHPSPEVREIPCWVPPLLPGPTRNKPYPISQGLLLPISQHEIFKLKIVCTDIKPYRPL